MWSVTTRPGADGANAIAAYRGEVHRARSIHEALAYGRDFCITCKAVLPGNAQVHLY